MKSNYRKRESLEPHSVMSHKDCSQSGIVGRNQNIDNIIEQERLKLHAELHKLSELRLRTHFSPPPPLVASLNDSSDIEEFKSDPTTTKKSQKINLTVHKPFSGPSFSSHKALTESLSTNSEELLLSTYEDSLMYSPPQCVSPTYILSSLKRNKPKEFFCRKEDAREICGVVGRSGKEAVLERLLRGGKQKISRKEMLERNKRLYSRLPEVREKERKEKAEIEKKVNYLFAKGLQEKLKARLKSKAGKMSK